MSDGNTDMKKQNIYVQKYDELQLDTWFENLSYEKKVQLYEMYDFTT